MKKTFGIQRDEKHVVLYNLKGLSGLNIGDIFFRYKDKTLEILDEFEYLDKEYLYTVLDNLSEEKQYDFSLLENKLI